jgi:cyclic pyranopterin monophosphate synthase
MTDLSHVDANGRATMVDVTAKSATDRSAVATATLTCAVATLALVREGRTPKGAVISTAELAGIMAAKRTADLIPLCHPLPLTKVAVEVVADEALPGFRITALARTTAQTGVEMEALTAASVAALTLFDMLKAVDQTMVVGDIRVIEKRGGKRDVG